MKNNFELHISIITLGCSKNQVDSEFLAGKLEEVGANVYHEHKLEKTNVMIINTCGFILDAKEESIKAMLDAVELKKQGQIEHVFAMGCLTQRYKEDIYEEIPELDGVFGVHDIDVITEKIIGYIKHTPKPHRVLSTPSHYAFLKIAEGCDHRCSFCAIPGIRGNQISKPIEVLVEEAKLLADKGVKELIVIAQELTYYGIDLYKKRMLAPLLVELEKIEGIEWIRLHYAFPAHFPMDVLDVMERSEKICRYLDIPLQHINSQLLKSMNRGINAEKTQALVHTIREKVPGVSLRTTLIVGYPGETEAMFQELVDFVKASRFDRLGVFPYSHEEDTPAYKLEDDVPQEEKERRVEGIMNIQSEISFLLNEKKVGKEMKVMIDREEEDFFVGRTEFDSPDVDNDVFITKSEGLSVGSFVNVVITQADYFDLYAELIK